MLYFCYSLGFPCSLVQAGLCAGLGRCRRHGGSTEQFRKPLPWPCGGLGVHSSFLGGCLTGYCSLLPAQSSLCCARCCSGPSLVGAGDRHPVVNRCPPARAAHTGVPAPRAREQGPRSPLHFGKPFAPSSPAGRPSGWFCSRRCPSLPADSEMLCVERGIAWGGVPGCPDPPRLRGAACMRGCASVLSLRPSPLQPFNFSAVAGGDSRGPMGTVEATLAAC